VNVCLKEQSWCFENNIKIYIKPIKGKKSCFIEINHNGKLITSPKIYNNQLEANKKIWQLYLYLYNNRNHEKN